MIDGFVEALLASPIGVALLARLETAVRLLPDGRLVLDTTPTSVPSAVDLVHRLSFGDLARLAVFVGEVDVGPWISEAADNAATAYREAERRAPVAQAIADRFGAELHQPLLVDGQEWWTTGGDWLERLAPLFHELEHVYGAGEFSWAGLWTVSDPPGRAQEELVGAWELHGAPVTRWRLPVRPEARVLEVHRPADWARLVAEHGRPATRPGDSWELPGPNQHRRHVAVLDGVPGQRAVRTVVRRQLVPDWRSVASAYDGVHLSWAGFITAQGCAVDLDGGDVAMLRYWASERTHWVADVFGDPAPLGAPVLPILEEQHAVESPLDVRTDPERRGRDERALRLLLGRAGL